MAKVAVVVNKALLKAAIQSAERTGPLESQSKVWEAACLFYNRFRKSNEAEVTASIVRSRAKEFSIAIKTPVGSVTKITPEQRQKMQANRGQRKSRADKMSNYEETFKRMKVGIPKFVLPMIERLEETGSLRLAINLKCLDCVCYSRRDVQMCTSTDCSLYPFRPYQKQAEITEEEDANPEAVIPIEE